MDRIGKIFGRKPEQTTPKEGGKAGSLTPPAAGNVEANHEAEKQEFYGLKLILDSGKEFAFSSLPVTIGRSEVNQIVLNDETVSSSHAMVYFDEAAQEVCILDLDSLNGLSIDQAPTRRNILSDGVKISLGAVNLVFRDTGYIHSQQVSH
jgi:hypothetical protein